MKNKNESAADVEIEIPVIVNGRQKAAKKKNLTFEEVVFLTFPMQVIQNRNTAFTITWKHEGKGGELSNGDTIEVKKGMIFNITATDKS